MVNRNFRLRDYAYEDDKGRPVQSHKSWSNYKLNEKRMKIIEYSLIRDEFDEYEHERK